MDMTPARIVTLGVLALALAVSVVTDLRSRKIYNWLTFSGMGLGLALNAWAGWGEPSRWFSDYGWKSSLAGLGLGFGFFFVPWLFGAGMGEGDVKMMGAVGALAGLKVTLPAIVFVAVAGGIEAVGYLLWRRRLVRTLKGMAKDAAAAVGVGEKEERERDHVPYALAIAAGTAWAVWWVFAQERAAAAVRALGGAS